MEPVSAQYMLFPTPLSKQEFAVYSDFYWPDHHISHHFEIVDV